MLQNRIFLSRGHGVQQQRAGLVHLFPQTEFVGGDPVFLVEETDQMFFQHSNHRYYPDRRDPWQKLFIVVDGDFMEELLRIHGLREVYHIRACRSLKHWFEHWVDQGSAPRSQEQYAVEFHQFEK